LDYDVDEDQKLVEKHQPDPRLMIQHDDELVEWPRKY